VIEGPKGRPEAPKAETYGANGITWAGKAGIGCRATNNVVYGNVHCGLKEMGHGGAGILMEANLIFNNGTRATDHGIYCPADELTSRGNIIFHNAGYGIHSYSSPKRQRIIQNICFGNRVCGIILAGSENQLLHNVCVDNGIGIVYFRGGCTDNVVRNNILFHEDRSRGSINIDAGSLPGFQSDFNIVVDRFSPDDGDQVMSLSRWQSTTGLDRHSIVATPQRVFVSPDASDFRLKDDSPAIDAADPSVAPPHDLEGRPRPVGSRPDIGAFENQSNLEPGR